MLIPCNSRLHFNERSYLLTPSKTVIFTNGTLLKTTTTIASLIKPFILDSYATVSYSSYAQ